MPRFTRVVQSELPAKSSDYWFRAFFLALILFAAFGLSIKAEQWATRHLPKHTVFDFHLMLIDEDWRLLDDATRIGTDGAIVLVECRRSIGLGHVGWFWQQLPFVSVSMTCKAAPYSSITSAAALKLAGQATDLASPWPEAITRLETSLLEPSLERDALTLLYARRPTMTSWSWFQSLRTLLLLTQASLLLAILVAWRQHLMYARMIARVERGQCPLCAYPIPEGERVCPECGVVIYRSWVPN